MKLILANASLLSQGDIFQQMLDIEQSCGIYPYSEDELMMSILCTDTWLLLDGRTVAGFINLDPNCMDYTAQSLHICNLNVAASYRRRGLAEWMIRTACGDYAKTHAQLSVTLDVEKTNVPALSLYHKLGFTILDMPSENGDDDWVMGIPLERLIC